MVAFFDGVSRAGPGDRASLDWAMACCALPPDGTVLDAGCGPGADIAALADHVPQGRVVAIDRSGDFIARVQTDHPGVLAHQGDMLAPPMGPLHAIWAAGSVYPVGIVAALSAWRAVLTDTGRVAFSHLCWRVDSPATAAQAYWAAEADITDVDGVVAQVQAAGFRVIGHRWLQDAAWQAYYTAIQARFDTCDDATIVAGFRAEIALWQAHGGDFGYLVLAVEPT